MIEKKIHLLSQKDAVSENSNYGWLSNEEFFELQLASVIMQSGEKGLFVHDLEKHLGKFPESFWIGVSDQPYQVIDKEYIMVYTGESKSTCYITLYGDSENVVIIKDYARLCAAKEQSVKYLNLTQHIATPEQCEQGVVDLSSELRKELVALLTFDDIPTSAVVYERARNIAKLAKSVALQYEPDADNGFETVIAMIGGAPFLMESLHSCLMVQGMRAVYAFSKRVSEETVDASTGQTVKTSVFKHVGFVPA